MFGPQFSFPLPKITPFAHGLFGIAHAIQNGTEPVDPFRGNNSIAVALGGGLDYHLTRHLAVRGQGDYLLTRFTYSDNQLHFTNNNLRISTGLVVRF
jgi:opacity protein-like surface antigen